MSICSQLKLNSNLNSKSKKEKKLEEKKKKEEKKRKKNTTVRAFTDFLCVSLAAGTHVSCSSSSPRVTGESLSSRYLRSPRLRPISASKADQGPSCFPLSHLPFHRHKEKCGNAVAKIGRGESECREEMTVDVIPYRCH